MVEKGSKLSVADNSGAKKLIVIGLGKGTGKRFATIGNIITCTVRGAIPNSQVKDHEIVKTVIVRTKKEIGRADGTYVRFSDNAAVVLDNQNNPRGSRIFGPIASELKILGFKKIASLAKEVL